MKVEGKVFFVTGGASGLGLTTVELLVARGAYVAILDINEVEGEQLSKRLGTEKTLFCRVDVSSEDDVKKAIELSDQKWPGKRVGGVVNCGGIAAVHQTLAKDGSTFPLDLFRKLLEVNLVGTLNVSQQVVARMVKDPLPEGEEERGVVILVSSSSYQEGQQGQVGYASSKGGVASMVLPMARDLGSYSIRVNGIAPSIFTTPMSAPMPEKLTAPFLRDIVFPKRFGKAEEFADFCVHLIENNYLNGEVFRITGGSRMSRLGKL